MLTRTATVSQQRHAAFLMFFAFPFGFIGTIQRCKSAQIAHQLQEASLQLSMSNNSDNSIVWKLNTVCSTIFTQAVREIGSQKTCQILVDLNEKFALRKAKAASTANILLHTFAAWLVQARFRDGSFDGARDVLLSLFDAYESQYDPQKQKITAALGFANGFFHGAAWQAIIMQLTREANENIVSSLCDSALNNSVQVRGLGENARYDIAKRTCLHGVGHGVMLFTILQKRNMSYDACMPLRFSSIWLGETEVRDALRLCLLCGDYAFSCASGAYHTYFSVGIFPVQAGAPWLLPCNQVKYFSMACFMFSMNDYDAEERRPIFSTPGECLLQPMASEHNTLGCIAMATGGVPRDLHSTAIMKLCDHLTSAPAVGYLNPIDRRRWAACFFGYTYSGVDNVVKANLCHSISSINKQLGEDLERLCPPSPTTMYPTWLLENDIYSLSHHSYD